MALRRKQKRNERDKLDATPPWERRERAAVAATDGPYDITDAPDDERERIDLGALRVPTSDLELRVDVNDAQQVVGVTLVGEHGHMQLGVFAAPRTEGIWDDVRSEIAESVNSQQGNAKDDDSDFGVDLVGRLPSDGALAPVRFVGVDGPRWMLRAMLVGPCATDAAKATPFYNVLREIVVVRGNDPLPVREPIPLALPDDVAEQIAAAQADGDAG
jgi:hypothetical protein